MKLALIVIVIIFIALAPVIGLRPSLRQRRQIALRDEARRQGIRVSVEKSLLLDNSPQTVAYRLGYPREQQGPRFALIREGRGRTSFIEREEVAAGWRNATSLALTDEAKEAVSALLAQLPDDAHLLESDASALTLWWEESLDVTAFAQLATPLKETQRRLAGRAVASRP